MSINYAQLARTPSGALTAASKRAVEAERIETQRKSAERYKRDQARREAEAEMRDLSDAYDNVFGSSATAITDREQRIHDDAFQRGVNQGKDDAVDDLRESLGDALYAQHHRMSVLGLDLDLTPLELIEKLRDAVAA